ncbi:ATP-binding protein [Streptomyces griseomycini]|uniref:Phosphoribosylformylglycinamidine (FGAM) synthase-like enzyme n=1 Tax=Streptomyces griseomycini TaxID=66895 RepID=A0A7W7PP58_9ACTN|nr:ATP-binding protein [Streptomyces griseomycini]MBB4897139.1 phosphoribosylformylglycinamidine (FGAM) synthase-like enzyme [Streptomyces griseomycini]GGP93511.1 ATP-binding protein [Streptomyces griseomycini]GGR34415.1 ATP-binding protein [Streptomyces griseomycini]
MSLPLTRRIARAALLVAAGAAAGVGAAGSASAAPELPTALDLGGLTALDGVTGNTVSSTAQSATETVRDADQVVPAVDTTVEKTAPVVKKLPTKSLTGGGVPSARTLPVQGLPLG